MFLFRKSSVYLNLLYIYLTSLRNSSECFFYYVGGFLSVPALTLSSFRDSIVCLVRPVHFRYSFGRKHFNMFSFRDSFVCIILYVPRLRDSSEYLFLNLFPFKRFLYPCYFTYIFLCMAVLTFFRSGFRENRLTYVYFSDFSVSLILPVSLIEIPLYANFTCFLLHICPCVL